MLPRNSWKEANQYFEKSIETAKTLEKHTQASVRRDYACALNRQGRTEEAKEQLDEAQKLTEELQKITEGIEEGFTRVNLEASLMAPWKVLTGEEFEMRLNLVNVSRKPGILVKAEWLLLPEFEVTSPLKNLTIENGSAEMKNRNIGPFQVETIKLKVKASKPGTFTFNPRVSYMDELGETKTCKPNPITITVQPAQPKYEVLPGRVPTGSEELDALLFGGIPQNLAVALTSPSTDEREHLIKRFLEAGATAGETTFYITAEAANTKG